MTENQLRKQVSILPKQNKRLVQSRVGKCQKNPLIQLIKTKKRTCCKSQKSGNKQRKRLNPRKIC